MSRPKEFLGLWVVLFLFLLSDPGVRATTLSHVWSVGFDACFPGFTTSVGVDSLGNIFLTGWFCETIDLGGGPLTSAGGYDIYLAKFDPGGTHVWSRRFGDALSQGAVGIAANAVGDVVVLIGSAETSLDLGGGVLANGNLFVAKYDTNGTHLWSRGFRVDPSAESSNHREDTNPNVVVDTSGNIFVAGSFTGVANIDGQSLTSGNRADIFVVKLDSNGVPVWSRSFGGGDLSDQHCNDVAVDSLGNVLLIGHFYGTLDLGGGPLTSVGYPSQDRADIFLAKLDTNGTHIWSKQIGDEPSGGILGIQDQWGYAIAADVSGKIVVAVGVTGHVIIMEGYWEVTGRNLLLVAIFNADGSISTDAPAGDLLGEASWQDLSPQAYRGVDMAVSGSGSIVVSGSIDRSTSLCPTGFTPGGWDIFLASLVGHLEDSASPRLEKRCFQSTPHSVATQEAHGLSVDQSDEIVMTGMITGAVDFGGGPLFAIDSWQVFLAKFCSDADGDSFCVTQDCDDNNPNRFPGNPELCDGLDNDCDGVTPATEADGDADGFRICQGDCDDSKPATHPGAPEVNDGRDNQCPGDPGYGVADELSGAVSFVDTDSLCWIPQSGARRYEIARSERSDFNPCVALGTTVATCFSDPAAPSVDYANYYLVRAISPNVGSWGQDSLGAERILNCQ